MRLTRESQLTLIALLLAGCASPGTESRMGNPDVITRAQIEDSSASTAYELVRTLRPQWLRTRGLSTLQQAAGSEALVIYLNNARMGAPSSMRSIPLGSVQFLRFFSAPEATQRWGGGHLHGAILISTQPR